MCVIGQLADFLLDREEKSKWPGRGKRASGTVVSGDGSQCRRQELIGRPTRFPSATPRDGCHVTDVTPQIFPFCFTKGIFRFSPDSFFLLFYKRNFQIFTGLVFPFVLQKEFSDFRRTRFSFSFAKGIFRFSADSFFLLFYKRNFQIFTGLVFPFVLQKEFSDFRRTRFSFCFTNGIFRFSPD